RGPGALRSSRVPPLPTRSSRSDRCRRSPIRRRESSFPGTASHGGRGRGPPSTRQSRSGPPDRPRRPAAHPRPCATPLVAKALHVDPAVFSTPFITTFCDATGLLIYFVIAKSVL